MARSEPRTDGLPVARDAERTERTHTARSRLRENPRPALAWLAAGAVLLAPEAGALVAAVCTFLPVRPPGIPTLLSRGLLPNQGYRTPDGVWHGTFLGLSPAAAWALRVCLVFAYVACWAVWGWAGYRLYRGTYRDAEWIPLDDAVDRFRSHRWGQFGLLVVLLFLAFGVFAPTVSPTTVDQNVRQPYTHQLSYYDADAGGVQTISAGAANLQTTSRGEPATNVGPLSYDRFGRYHPFGTLPSGRDLFTFMAYGARVSLFIGLLSIGLSVLIAATLALYSAYYRGGVDLVAVLLGDAVQSVPQLLVLILLSVAFAGTWLASLYSGGVLIALVFAGTGWPGLWRAIRGPALQVAREDWVRAARGFGQRPTATMRRHVLPYVVGYLLVYSSMILGGIIIGIAGLSFLGLGVSPPTPEWGRAINAGEPYLDSVSWHVSLLPGLLIVLVVTGFNALGDGVRDAIDPQSTADDAGSAESAAAGGGA